PANATSVFPDNTHGTTPNPTPPPDSKTPTPPEPPTPTTLSTNTDSTGACSRITCPFLPLIPNDDTPAPRNRPPSTSQGLASVRSDTAPDSQSTCRDGSSTCNDAGITP